LGGLLACESQLQVPARAPGLVFPPTPISHYNSVQLHSICRRPPILLSPFTSPAQPPATLRRPPQSNRPVTKPTYNGSAHHKLPARAVLCAFAGPLIKDHGANTHIPPTHARVGLSVTTVLIATSILCHDLQCRLDSQRAQGFCDFPAREESAHVRLDFTTDRSILFALFG
jgi:hypothetical protein